MKILYRDQDIIVAIKPAGAMSTDEAGGMPDLIREAIGTNGPVRCVHRLDSVVAGLMVYAFTTEAAAGLTRQIEASSFKKAYFAVLEGTPDKSAGKLTDYLRRNPRERKTYAVKGPGKGAEDAALIYRTIKKTRGLSLVRVELITGRTHQIRAQFSSRNLPLYGDRKYGAKNPEANIALWSCSLTFAHPITGQAMKFEALPPEREPWNLFAGYHDAYEEVDVVREFQRKEHLGDCPYADNCGECAYQGMEYGKQLEKKQRLAGKWLKAYGNMEEIVGVGSEASLHYKNKIIRSFAIAKNGKLLSCISPKAKKKFVPIRSCLIENEKAKSVIATIRDLMTRFHLQPYDASEKTGWLKHAIVQVSKANGDILLTLVTASADFPYQKEIVETLLAEQPSIKTIIQSIHTTPSPALLGKEEKVLWGPGFIEDTFLGKNYRLNNRSNFPENLLPMENLYEKALSCASINEDDRVLYAYCGSGMLGISAADHAARVLCVDRYQDLVNEGKKHAERNCCKNMKFICSEPKEYIDALARSHDPIDVVFLDYTRSRITRGTMAGLIKLGPEKIICMTDDPESIAGELEMLKKSAYCVTEIVPIDIAPFVQKVGVVILVERKR